MFGALSGDEVVSNTMIDRVLGKGTRAPYYALYKRCKKGRSQLVTGQDVEPARFHSARKQEQDDVVLLELRLRSLMTSRMCIDLGGAGGAACP